MIRPDILGHTPWLILQSGPGSPALNMALDEALHRSAVRSGLPVLRFYGWTEPAATFGYSQGYEEVSRWTTLRPLIRRSTGGGLVPHDRDWTYSVVIPPAHPWFGLKAIESYQLVHAWVGAAFRRIQVTADLAPEAIPDRPGQCFLGAEKFDLLVGGKKIAGAAQRRNRDGLLIQGSVQPSGSNLVRTDWESAMLALIESTPIEPSDALLRETALLTETKYSQASYNQKR